MKLRSEDCKSSFALDPCGAELTSYPSLCFSVSIETPDVVGGIGELWFELDAVEKFISGIAELDQTRRGSVKLVNMSPEEFELKLFALNSRGHLGLGVNFSGVRLSDEVSFPFSISASFRLEPTSLRTVADALRQDIDLQRTSSNKLAD